MMHAAPFAVLSRVLLAGSAISISTLCSPVALAQPATPPAAASSHDADDLALRVPIRTITLYRSGVGYFERQGRVEDVAKLQLRFKTDQINDILKSLVLLDLDGGKIESVSYGSKEPLSKRLASFGIDIADSPSAGEILQRLRGTPVKVSTIGGEVSGTILNVETKPTVYQGNADRPTSVHNLPWINLVTKGGVRSINLAESTGFEILDPSLADELNKALAALAEHRADRSKTVDIRFTGAGARRVVVGYVHEMPVWKTSYRLILPDPAGDAQAKPDKAGLMTLQGWAIVENTTDQDWNGVKLALVSGRPVSFQMDLYEPLFTFRPTLPVPTIPGVLPRAYAGGTEYGEPAGALERKAKLMMGRAAMESMAPGSPAPSAKPRAGAGGFVDDAAAGSMQAAISADDLANYAAQSQATGVDVGEVFQYQLDAPVTIERQRSAMLPILTGTVKGRRVSIYSPTDGREHPMRGVEIVNDSGLQLLPGPISVFDSATYAGDAQIGQVAKGDKRLLAYALDLDVNVLTKNEEENNTIKIRIINGAFEQTIKSATKTTYTFDNKDAKRARTIVIEQPKLMGWELVSKTKPVEETQSALRFETEIAAAKKAELVIAHERTESSTVGLTSIELPTLLAYQKQGKVSDAVIQAIRDLGRRQGEINAASNEAADFGRQIEEITKEQARLRDNMSRLERTDPLYARYVKKLSDQESQFEELRDKREKAVAKARTLAEDLQNHLRTLSID